MQRFSTYTISRAFRNGKDAPEGDISEGGEDPEETDEPENAHNVEVQTEEILKPDAKETEA